MAVPAVSMPAAVPGMGMQRCHRVGSMPSGMVQMQQRAVPARAVTPTPQPMFRRGLVAIGLNSKLIISIIPHSPRMSFTSFALLLVIPSYFSNLKSFDPFSGWALEFYRLLWPLPLRVSLPQRPWRQSSRWHQGHRGLGPLSPPDNLQCLHGIN